eukprot:SM000018S03626  [mRNA]  locus=s18:369470:372222:- [translate_table: standard]
MAPQSKQAAQVEFVDELVNDASFARWRRHTPPSPAPRGGGEPAGGGFGAWLTSNPLPLLERPQGEWSSSAAEAETSTHNGARGSRGTALHADAVNSFHGRLGAPATGSVEHGGGSRESPGCWEAEDEDEDGGDGVAAGGSVRGGGRWRRFSWRDTGDALYAVLRERGADSLVAEAGAFVEAFPPSTGALPIPQRMRFEFHLPRIQPLPHAAANPGEYFLLFLADLQERRARASGQPLRHLLVLLAADSAALGTFSDGQLVAHKVVTAYTIRAKQGKSQLKHLRQGGSAGRMSAGGGLRVQEARRFVHRIAEASSPQLIEVPSLTSKLREWKEEVRCADLLFYSGDVRLWKEASAPMPACMLQSVAGWQGEALSVSTDDNILASQDVSGLLGPRDDRWLRVPMSIRAPRFKDLERVFYALSHGKCGLALAPAVAGGDADVHPLGAMGGGLESVRLPSLERAPNKQTQV